MTGTKADEAAVHVKHWLTQHPGRAAAARFPIDELRTLLDERAERLELTERIAAERDRLHDALSEVLASGGPEFDGKVQRGLSRTLWITPERLQGWRRLLAGTPRSESDGETALTAPVAPAGVAEPSSDTPDLGIAQRGAAGHPEAPEADARPEATP